MANRRDCPDLARLLAKLEGQLSYSDIQGLESRFELDERPFESARQSYRKGYLTKDEAAKLVRWKTGGMYGLVERFCENNEEDGVQRITKAAAEAQTPGAAVVALCNLRCVAVATASAFLTAQNPDSFGILDIRCWRSLRNLADDSYFDRGRRKVFSVDEFKCYTQILRDWSAHAQVKLSPRIIDKALWQYDKEQSKKAR